jgi:hypothetical protein
MSKKTKVGLIAGGAVLVVGAIVCALIFLFPSLMTGGGADRTRELQALLDDESRTTIELNGTYIISKTLHVKGTKVLTGSAKISMKDKAVQPEGAQEFKPGEGPKFGCPKLDALDASTQLNMFIVDPKANLTVGGKVTIDGNSAANGIYVSKEACLTIAENADFKGAYYTNIANDGTLTVSGGKLDEAAGHNVINNAQMEIKDGQLTGSQDGAVVYNAGTLSMSGGKVEKSKKHNIYVASTAKFTISGGEIGVSKIDGIYVEQGATADVSGGTISGSTIHSVDSAGSVLIGDVSITNGGLLNNGGGKMEIKGAKISETESQAIFNNGGEVTGSDVTITYAFNFAIYNMGTMSMEGLVIDKVSQNAIENAANSKFTGSNIKITDLGKGRNGVRNFGSMDISDVSIDGAYHTIYNEGDITAKNINITKSEINAIYNKGGKVKVDVFESGRHRGIRHQ